MAMDKRDGAEALADAQLVTTLRYDPQLESCKTNPTIAGEPSPFYMLTYHHQRLVDAVEYMGFPKALDALGNIKTFQRTLEAALSKARDASGGSGGGALRVRVAIGREGVMDITSQPIAEVPLSTLYPEALSGYTRADGNGGASETATAADPNQWAVVVTPDHNAASALTTFKSDKRAVYNVARDKAQGMFDKAAFSNFEALLVDDQARVLDGAICAVYFRRDGAWVTPPTGTGQGRWGALKSVSRRWALDHGLAIEGHIPAATVAEGERVWLSNGARGFLPGVIVHNSLRA